MENITSRKLSFTIVCFYLFLYGFYLFHFRNSEWMLTAGGNLFQTLAPLISSFWLFNRYLKENSRDRKFWLFLSLAIFSYAIAMVFWDYYEIYLKINAPYPSIPDLFWMIMNIFIFTAFIYLIVINRKTLRIIQTVYDAIIVIVVAAFTSWEFVLKPIIENSADQGFLYIIIGISYPISDLGILFCLLCFFTSKSIKFPRKVFLFLFFGIGSFLFADTVYLYLQAKGLYKTGNPVDPLWSAGILLIGLSTFYASGEVAITSHYQKTNETGNKSWGGYFLSPRLWMPYIGVLCLFLLTVYQDKGFNSITVGSIISIVLIIFRQMYTLMENQQLLDKITNLNKDLEQKVQQRTNELFKKNLQLKSSIKKVEYLAYHDPMTGLYNRRYFNKYLSDSLINAKQNNQSIAVLFLDLDRFKLINDSLGHSVGDLLLQQITKRLVTCIGDSGIICRQGGDEFILLLQNAERVKAASMAENILDSLKRVVHINGNELIVTSTIGISLFPENGEESADLIQRADIAMYSAKKALGNQYVFYDTSMNSGTPAILSLERDLRYAVERKELSLVYQPLVQIQSGNIIGVEALIRWYHPSKGWISPQKFIPVAEETGLIIPLGLWVLETACQQWKVWEERGLPRFFIAVNISINQFLDANFLEHVRRVIKETKMNPEYLELEITENIPFDSSDALGIIHALTEMGIKLSIDDFGTGYSSLQYLKKLPIHKLKIDQSFIKELPNNLNDAAIVQTIIAMAEHMRLEVVAEGVETKEQLDFLKMNICQIAQGYYFSKPLTSVEFETQFSQIETLVG